MQIRNLGGSGLRVSAVGLGCNNFGQRTDLETSRKVIHKAIDLGITLFDTADIYAGMGGSETVLGAVLGDRRKDIVLATKYSKPMATDGTKQGASRRYIMSAVEASLTRLKTDYIDLYQQHDYDPLTPMEETLRALDDLVSAGKILYIGASNYAAYRLMNSLWLAKTHHWAKFVTLQAQYSLIVRDLEREHVPLCRDMGLGILPWSPLAGGLLSGGSQNGRSSSEDVKNRRSERGGQLDAYEAFAAERGWTPAALGLAWLLHQPGVTGPIIGPRTVAQLESAVSAVDISLTADDLRALDELFPGPGGQAPEAYAW
jgi:aryl-alcohol dehydrogenase-like predicted oxidoreductase